MRPKNTIKNIIHLYIWYLSGISNIPIRQNERKSIETLGKDPSGSKKTQANVHLQTWKAGIYAALVIARFNKPKGKKRKAI